MLEYWSVPPLESFGHSTAIDKRDMVITIGNQIGSIPFGRLFYFAFVPLKGSFVFLTHGSIQLLSYHTALVPEYSSTGTSPGTRIGPALGISAYLLLPDMIARFTCNL